MMYKMGSALVAPQAKMGGIFGNGARKKIMAMVLYNIMDERLSAQLHIISRNTKASTEDCGYVERTRKKLG